MHDIVRRAFIPNTTETRMGKVKAGDDIFFTQSMAEVLEKQGLYEDALIIYKILADTTPWDETLDFKIERLKEMAAGSRKRSSKETEG